MSVGAITLANNVSSTGAQSWRTWVGGRAVITANAQTYPSTLNVEIMGPSGAPIAVNGSTINSDCNIPCDLPPGLIRVNLVGGSPSGVYVTVSSIQY